MVPHELLRKRALILKLGQIGDVIMAIPAVHALYQQGFQIDWICGQAVYPLLSCYSWIHPIRVNDKAILFGSSSERMQHILALWREITGKQYDLCATLYYDRRYRVLTFPVRSKRKIMLSPDSRKTSLLPGRHHIDEYERVLLEREDGFHDWSLKPVPPDSLPSSPLQGKRTRRIALVPGGVNHLIHEQASGNLPEQALRRWPVESYVTVAENIVRDGGEVVLLGSHEDVWVKSYFQKIAFTDCVGTLTLPQVVSLCGACDAVVTHDTGPLHLAGLSNTCIVGIFGPTDPSTRVPRRSSVVGIWGGQGFACRPCYDGRNFAPCAFNGCMHQVTPNLVLRELDRLLEERDRGVPKPWRVVCPEGSAVQNEFPFVHQTEERVQKSISQGSIESDS